MKSLVNKNMELIRERIIVHDDGERKLYFCEWVKNREGIPLELKEMFEKIGAKEEDSIPIFSNDPDEALLFTDPGMAMQVMRKQQEMYPEWREQLYSIPWVSRKGETAEERLLNAMYMESPEIHGQDGVKQDESDH